jgi:glutathione S-transferase
VIAAHGSPIPFLRKGSRDALRAATGAEKLPALRLPDGTVITHSRAILNWISRQDSEASRSVRPAARERSQALQSR